MTRGTRSSDGRTKRVFYQRNPEVPKSFGKTPSWAALGLGELQLGELQLKLCCASPTPKGDLAKLLLNSQQSSQVLTKPASIGRHHLLRRSVPRAAAQWRISQVVCPPHPMAIFCDVTLLELGGVCFSAHAFLARDQPCHVAHGGSSYNIPDLVGLVSPPPPPLSPPPPERAPGLFLCWLACGHFLSAFARWAQRRVATPGGDLRVLLCHACGRLDSRWSCVVAFCVNWPYEVLYWFEDMASGVVQKAIGVALLRTDWWVEAGSFMYCHPVHRPTIQTFRSGEAHSRRCFSLRV